MGPNGLGLPSLVFSRALTLGQLIWHKAFLGSQLFKKLLGPGMENVTFLIETFTPLALAKVADDAVLKKWAAHRTKTHVSHGIAFVGSKPENRRAESELGKHISRIILRIPLQKIRPATP